MTTTHDPGADVRQPIAIIGGGLAGLAAAVRLAESSRFRPIVIESRKRLGGRATSLTDPRSGHVIDNCQHVLMGCCTHLIDLYERLGVLDSIQWHERLFWTEDGLTIDELAPSWLPAPLHMSRAFLRMKLFTLADKRAIARVMWRMIRMGYAGRLAWRHRTFAAFLDDCRQPPRVVRRFWNVVIVSACNLDVEHVGAEYALQVFQEAFLAGRWSVTMGVPTVPLATLYDPAERKIENAGGAIHLGESARSIGFDGTRVSGVVTGSGQIQASAVIAAVPPDRLARLVSTTMRQMDGRLSRLDAFTWSPIVGVHLVFDQEVMDLPHLTLVDHDVHWLFNKGTDANGHQHLHAVISAATGWVEQDEPTIAARVLSDVHAVLPRSVGLEPVDVRSIKEKHATYAAVPGLEQDRPAAEAGTIGLAGGGISNLYLAGDWCDTGWPATMEGAVRSGYAAADAIMGGEASQVGEVEAGLLARVLGLR